MTEKKEKKTLGLGWAKQADISCINAQLWDKSETSYNNINKEKERHVIVKFWNFTSASTVTVIVMGLKDSSASQEDKAMANKDVDNSESTPAEKKHNKISYEGKMILAPMVKIGTLPHRLLSLKFGADLVYTEEIIDFRLLRSRRVENAALDTVDYVDRDDGSVVLRISPRERGRLVLQVGTADAGRAAAVGRMVRGDVDAVDVNMGCPKSFSVKGGMGAALLTQPDKVKDILTSLVGAVDVPVTCKIRILPKLDDTLKLVRVIEETGVSALAVHGRTKEERPNDSNHTDVIRQVAEACKLPVIANGGSGNSRGSWSNTHEGITSFWKESGASSVMVARAAEWNPSVFSPQGKLPIMEIVDMYVDLAVEFDQPFVTTKYCIAQLLGGEQESEIGKRFLAASTMRDLCQVFGREDAYDARQAHLRRHPQPTSTFRFRRESRLAPKRRKLDNDDEVTEMFCPFVRGHFGDGLDIPKVRLQQWCRDRGEEQPKYETAQTDKTFRSVVTVAGRRFSSEAWEKNKKYAEQAAAIVALHCLGIRKVEGAEEEEEERVTTAT